MHPQARKNDRIWQNLLDTKCPKCGQRLSPIDEYLKCGIGCGFVIRQEKAQEIVVNLERKAQGKITHVAAILPNGKIKFKAGKVHHGPRPEQKFFWEQ